MKALAQLLALQRRAFNDSLPEPLSVRRDRLKRATAMIRDNADRFCDAMSDDFGNRSREQSMLTDMATSIGALQHAGRHLDRWARRDRRPVRFPLGLLGARAWVEYQPKGVVGVIAPWNFPVNLVMAPLAGVFAAGNRALVKTSEFTPATAALFEEVCSRYFQPDELAFVSGGSDVGRAFAALPFDHLVFTGATGVGRQILRAAADNLTPVTLELGGKSPAVIGSDADIAQATDRIAAGKLLNAGQICLAPDYVLVPERREQEAVDGLKRATNRLYPSLLTNPDYASIVNDRHHERLSAWVDDARAKGGLLETAGSGERPFGSNDRRMPLHLVRRTRDDMIVMQEEIFGPILPVVTYRDIDEAVAWINRGARPLALYYFGPNGPERRRVLDRTISGGVTLDDVVMHFSVEDLPFGGIGPSGMGAYHGVDGFRTFSHAKAVYRQPRRIDVAKLAGIKPPYGAATRRSITSQMR